MAGKNVWLASQLTGYRLTVKSLTQFGEEMSSPEARAQLEQLFSQRPESGQNSDEDYTPLNELPGLSPRVIGLLEAAGVNSVEELIELEESDLEKLEGIGQATARQILRIVAETVEVEEV